MEVDELKEPVLSGGAVLMVLFENEGVVVAGLEELLLVVVDWLSRADEEVNSALTLMTVIKEDV